MQTVYVVLAHFDDHDNVLGVFSSETIADRYAASAERDFGNRDPEPEVYVQPHDVQ